MMGFAERILEQPIELIEGVEDTLAQLAARHELTLFTKGNAEEQRLESGAERLAALLPAHRDCEGKGPLRLSEFWWSGARFRRRIHG